MVEKNKNSAKLNKFKYEIAQEMGLSKDLKTKKIKQIIPNKTGK